MVTMLEVYNTEEQRSIVRFLWAKRVDAKDMRKEIFPVYCGMCLLHKATHNWVEKFSQGHSKVANDAQPGGEVAETAVKRFLCSGFGCTGKAMGRVYQCWWKICQEIIFFFRF
jgi:hypothetical protein